MKIISTSRQIGKTIRSAGRLRTIVGVFAKHGFQDVAARARLGRFILHRSPEILPQQYTPQERMRMAFEELGPAFVKFGQLLASRPDFIPPEYIEEFKKLHDQVATVPFEDIKTVLENHFSKPINEVLLNIVETPLAAASIAQVHRGILLNGTEVVLKVQRPGIVKIISEDLNVLYTIASLLERYIPESKPFNPSGLVDEFFKTLQLETDFAVEANNINRFEQNFRKNTNIKIPKVFKEYSGKNVLVLEALQGIPLSNPASAKQEGVDPAKVASIGLRAYFEMVYKHGFFHGDLHAGNLFILPDGKIGLIDFGVVGRLSNKARDGISAMFVALANEDFEEMAWEYLELSGHSEYVDVDEFARNLRDLISPYMGLTFKDMNLGKLLLDSTAVAARYRLQMPKELMLFFKSIVSIEGMGRLLLKDFDILNYALEFSAEIAKEKFDPIRLGKEFYRTGRDTHSLLVNLPRQLRILMRQMTNPDHAKKIHLEQMDEFKRSVESSSNLLFLGLVIGSLIFSGTYALNIPDYPTFLGIPALSATAYLISVFLSLVAFYNYVKK